MKRQLEPALDADHLKDVGQLHHFPAQSTVLQQRRGYSTLFRVYNRLRLSTRIPFDLEDLSRLLDARDIAELYELWCYFSMVRALSYDYGPPIRADALLTTDTSLKAPWGYRVDWPTGETLYYNLSFSR